MSNILDTFKIFFIVFPSLAPLFIYLEVKMLPEFLLIRQCIPWKFRKTHQTLEFGTKFKFQTMFNLLPELLIGNWMISMLDIRYIKFMMKIFFVFPLNLDFLGM